MKKPIILILLFCCQIVSVLCQVDTLSYRMVDSTNICMGYYENNNIIGQTGLSLFCDSTFEKKIQQLHYDLITGDSIQRGKWSVSHDSLILLYDIPINSINKLLITPHGFKDLKNLTYFYKTKEFDTANSLVWKENVLYWITQYDSISFKDNIKREEIIQRLNSWIYNKIKYSFDRSIFLDYNTNLKENIFLQEVFFVSQIKYIYENTGTIDKKSLQKAGALAILNSFKRENLKQHKLIQELEELVKGNKLENTIAKRIK
jgi:hypothetical protein